MTKDSQYLERSRKVIYAESVLKSIITQIPANGNFLEAGCGSGSFLRDLVKYAAENNRQDINFFGFDQSDMSLQVARQENPNEEKVCLKKAALPNCGEIFGEMKFDYINCMDVLFFMQPQQQLAAVKNLKELLTEHGNLRLVLFKPREDGNLFSQEIHPIDETALQDLMQQAGFEDMKIITSEKTFRYGGEQGIDYLKIFCNAKNSHAMIRSASATALQEKSKTQIL